MEIEVATADRAGLETDRGPQQPARARLAGADHPGDRGWSRWQERFMTEGVEGLRHDKTRPARIRPLPKAVVGTVVTCTLREPPPDGGTH